MFYHIETGKPHDFPHFLTVTGSIAVCLTLLTHRFGVIGALEQLGDTMIEQLATVRAQQQGSVACCLSHGFILAGKQALRFVPVILPAEDVHKIRQYPGILILFLV